MEYQKLVQDFMARTQANLRQIQHAARAQNQNNPEVFEVTQLINSMLGLLILPKEKQFGRISKISLSDPRLRFLPKVLPSCPNCGDVKTVGEYLQFLRNGIAHFNIEFESVDGTTTAMTIQNKCRRKVTHTFRFTVEEMERFAVEFPKLLGVGKP